MQLRTRGRRTIRRTTRRTSRTSNSSRTASRRSRLQNSYSRSCSASSRYSSSNSRRRRKVSQRLRASQFNRSRLNHSRLNHSRLNHSRLSRPRSDAVVSPQSSVVGLLLQTGSTQRLARQTLRGPKRGFGRIWRRRDGALIRTRLSNQVSCELRFYAAAARASRLTTSYLRFQSPPAWVWLGTRTRVPLVARRD